MPRSGAVPRCYTQSTPTKHPRVSVTVTPELHDARERLARQSLNPSVGELALTGAQYLLRTAEGEEREEERRRELRKRLVESIKRGELIDVDVLEHVHEHAWNRY